jgi:transcriptional regulator of heat shock response
MMKDRRAEVLRLVVEEYIRSAEPVSSKLLTEKYRLPCSTATVRSDLAALEEAGLLHQPHTSAGRVPTERAYKWYIQHFVGQTSGEVDRPDVQVTITVRRLVRAPSAEDRLTALGNAVAEASGDAVMIATTKPWRTTLGLHNLLRKPDFRGDDGMQALASGLERIDGALSDFLSQAGDDVRVILGLENPFGPQLASVVVRHRIPGGHGIMSIVGPLRMNYSRNMAILTEAKRLIEQPQLDYRP